MPPNITPIKSHLLLISKTQLFCSEEEDTIQGRQTTSHQLAINHMSTLGQNRDVPQEKFITVICKPWQPAEREREERTQSKGYDHVDRACSAQVSQTEQSTTCLGLPRKRTVPTASDQDFGCPFVMPLAAR